MSVVWSPETRDGVSHYWIEKDREPAELCYAGGARVRGHFFVAAAVATHAGRERVIDLLNGPHGFLPFEVDGPEEPGTRLVNPQHILYVRLERDGIDLAEEPTYATASQKAAAVVFADGTRLQGTVYVFRPAGRDRLSDYARSLEQFRYLLTPDALLVVNFAQVAELVPLAD